MSGAGTSTSNQNVTKSSQESGTTANTSNSATTGTGTTATSSNSSSGPWSATSGLLGNIISTLNGLSGSTSPTGAQSEALANLQSSASGLPNFGNAGSSAVSNILGGNYSGMLTDNLNAYKSNLSPYLSSSYLNPLSTPGLSDALASAKNDITNDITSRFAAAGRSMSPAETQALSKGLTQGIAPILTSQYNTNVGTQRGAQDALLGAGQNNVGMLTNLGSTGISLAGAVPGLYTQPAQTQLGVANTAYNLPISNVSSLSDLATKIASLGSTSSSSTSGTNATTGSTTGSTTGNYSGTGSSNSTGTSSNTASLLSDLSSLFGGGQYSAASGMLSLLSDARAKDDIKPVGMLFDGTPVASFNYKGDPRPQIGLIAQDVEKRQPDAVHEVGGLKRIDYGKATAKSRALGMLSGLNIMA